MADDEPNVINRDQKPGRRRLHLRGVVEASDVDPDTAAYDGIGTQLKAARERTGATCTELASRLRIREPYLHAIEDGRFNDLPGPVYAVGFIRSYANAVGLDGEDFVFRFKQETAARPDQTRLRFPAPEAESRLPSGRLLVLSLLLVGAVYGGWYYISNVDRSSVEHVPAVPERLVAKSDSSPAPRADKDEVANVVETDSGLSRANAATAMTEIETNPAQTAGSATLTPLLPVTSPAPTADAGAPRAEQTMPTVAGLAATPEVTVEAQLPPTAAVPISVPGNDADTSATVSVSTDVTASVVPTVPEQAPAPAEARAEPGPSTNMAPGANSAVPAMPQPVQVIPASELDQTRDLRQRPGRNNAFIQTDARSELAEDGAVDAVEEAPPSARTAGSATPNRTADADIEQPTTANETELAVLSVPEPPAPNGSSRSNDEGSIAPRTFGSNSAESRVTLTARLDSWVQVVSDDNELLLTRILRAGDTYYVPNRPGLMLLTGNAGALEVSVDGQSLPPIGPIGAVRRNVSLDPESLLGAASQSDQ